MRGIYPFALTLVLAQSAYGSLDSMGIFGINSISTGLSGAGIPIGQLEPGRPGIVGYDTDANCCNGNVQPGEYGEYKVSGTD